MSMTPDNQLSYLFEIQEQIHTNIQLADQKALVFVVLDTGLISAVYGTELLSVGGSWLVALGTASIALMALGVLAAVWVIRPRFRGKSSRPKTPGFTNQAAIVLWRNDPGGFQAAFSNLSYEQLRDDLLLFVLERSKADEAKYFWLRWSISISLVGWAGGMAFFLAQALA